MEQYLTRKHVCQLFTTFAHYVPIRIKTLPQEIFFWLAEIKHLIIFCMVTSQMDYVIFEIKHLCKVLYNTFCLVQTKNMAILDNSGSEWLTYNICSHLNLLGQMEPNLTGTNYTRNFIALNNKCFGL